MVDEEDFERVSKFNWSVAANRYAAYRAPAGPGKRNGPYVYMHRFVTDAGPGETVDHFNHDELDNRKFNLRKASQSQQGQNKRKPIHNTSGKKGVYFDKRRSRWVAEIRISPKRKVHLGRFVDLDKAGQAYDEAAVYFFGEFALPNTDPRISK